MRLREYLTDVEAEARRTKRSKGAVVEALTEEASRMRRFPGIAFRGEGATPQGVADRDGLDVRELIEMLQGYDSVKRLVEDHENVSPRSADVAKAYYASNREEIDEKIADNRRPFSELREPYPYAGFTFAGADE